MDYVKNIQTVSFYFEGIIRNIEPVAFINGSKSLINAVIKENDDVSIVIPTTISEYEKYFCDDTRGLEFMIDNKKLLSDYVIKEGDRIYKVPEVIKKTTDEKKDDKNKDKNEDNKNEYKETQTLNVKVNKNMIILKGKDKYIFVDVFDYVDFDLTISKGNLILKLNGSKADYYQPLNNGDVIEIYWENIIGACS